MKYYWMAETEITQGQWRAVVGETPWSGKDYMEDGDRLAAAYISWNDVHDKLLPNLGSGWNFATEPQWEYACRAGMSGRFPWGESVSDMGKYANVADRTGKNKYSNWNIVKTAPCRGVWFSGS